MEPILSVIIPHYNSAEYLERLIKSIPVKEEIQVIVVDDNSPKREVEEVIKKYSYVEFYSNLSGRNSAGTCRNVGLKYAKGKWLLFADADDYFVDGFWEIIVPYFASEKDIVYFSPTSIINKTGETAKRHIFYENLIKEYVQKPSEKNELFLRYEFVSPCSKLIRREIVEKNKIEFEGVRYANDVMFSTKTALCAKKIAVCEKTIYVITQMEGTLTTAMSEENFMQRLDVFIRKVNLLKKELSREQSKLMSFNGTGQVISIFKHKFGMKVLWTCIRKLTENGIPVINPNYFRVKFWLEKIEQSRRRNG